MVVSVQATVATRATPVLHLRVVAVTLRRTEMSIAPIADNRAIGSSSVLILCLPIRRQEQLE
jgi:hypothetical protein